MSRSPNTKAGLIAQGAVLGTLIVAAASGVVLNSTEHQEGVNISSFAGRLCDVDEGWIQATPRRLVLTLSERDRLEETEGIIRAVGPDVNWFFDQGYQLLLSPEEAAAKLTENSQTSIGENLDGPRHLVFSERGVEDPLYTREISVTCERGR